MPEYALLCLDVSEYIYEYALNLPEWFLFYCCDLNGNELEKCANIYANID